jgi:hypothetical protein
VAPRPRSLNFAVTEKAFDVPGCQGFGDPVIDWNEPGTVSRAPVVAVGDAASAVASWARDVIGVVSRQVRTWTV